MYQVRWRCYTSKTKTSWKFDFSSYNFFSTLIECASPNDRNKTIKTNSTQNFSNRERKNCPNFSCKKNIYFSKMLISGELRKITWTTVNSQKLHFVGSTNLLFIKLTMMPNIYAYKYNIDLGCAQCDSTHSSEQLIQIRQSRNQCAF